MIYERNILASGQTATGPSASIDSATFKTISFYIAATGVTTGGTVKIQCLFPDGVTWGDLDIRNITRSESVIVAVEGVFSTLRVNVTATDGTTAWAISYDAKG